MAQKTISIDSLTVGMYICGIDRPWMETPFLRHRFLLKNQEQIKKLRQCGVKEVTIDLDQGIDVTTCQDNQPVPTLEAADDEARTHSHAADQETTPEEQISNLPPTLRGKSLSNELSSTREVRSQMLDSVRDVLHSISTSGVVQADEIKDVTHDIIAQTLEHEEAFIALTRTREFSPDLHEHSLSVGTLAVLLGRLVGYDNAQLQTLGTAALLHDIGLLRLPKSLLSTKSRTSDEETEQYFSHAQLGVELLKESEGISEEVRTIVGEHHVLLDGTGFPRHINPTSVTKASRLLRIVDEYDELLTGQQGQSPMSGKEALRALYQRGQQQKLDRQLVSQFISQVGIYPIYSLVQLNTGERGIVTAHSKENLLHPTILLIQDATKQPFLEPVPINFSTIPDGTELPEIVEVLDPEQEGIRVEKVLADWVTI